MWHASWSWVPGWAGSRSPPGSRPSATTSSCASRRAPGAASSAATPGPVSPSTPGRRCSPCPAVYRDLFVKTGKPLEDSVELLPVDPVARYRFPALGGHDVSWLDVPNASRARLRTALDEALGPGAGDDWDRFLDRAHAIWQVTRVPFLESPLAGGRDLLRLARRPADVRTVAPWQTLRGLGEQYLRDPRLRMLLDRYATYSGSDPRRAPAALAVVPYVEQTFGAWYVAGGLRRLGEAVRRARAAARRHPAHRHDGRLRGRRSRPGDRRRARGRRAGARRRRRRRRRRAPPLRRPAAPRRAAGRARRRLHRATPSLSGFVLLLALRGRTPGLAHHTVLFPDDYDAEFDAVFGRAGAAPVDDPTVYVSAPDDPALRPDDDSRGVVRAGQRPAARHRSRARSTGTPPGSRPSYADRVLDVMAAPRARRPRPGAVARGAHARRPRAATRSPGGAIYGTSSQRGARRVPPARPTSRRCPGCSWSAARRTPAAGCRWSGCRPRSSPTWSARPDALSAAGGVRRRRAARGRSHRDPTQAPAPRGRPGGAQHGPGAARNRAVTITRVGRSHTVTTPTSVMPAAPARARRYSCRSISAPPSGADLPDGPRPAAARRGGAGRRPGPPPRRAPAPPAVARPVSTATAPSTLSSSAGQDHDGRGEQRATGRRPRPASSASAATSTPT